MRHATFRSWFVVLAGVAMAAAIADEAAAPRTGYFRIATTPLELLGEQGATRLSDVFEPDETLEWQLYVPANYDAARPAGVVVFVNRNERGGGRKTYNPVFDEKNLIWMGPINAGDGAPVNERIMKSILAPVLLAQSYAVDPARIYVGGFSGGAHVAAILATSKPELFRGSLFVGGARFWEERTPERLDVVRQNRYVFLVGQNDVALDTVRRTVQSYRGAGVTNTKLIMMQNMRQEMPGPGYLADAIDYLDGTVAAE